MNVFHTYYEKIGDRYVITCGKYYDGYSDDYTVFCDVLDMETWEEVENIKIDFLDMFKVFCDMCRKYDM